LRAAADEANPGGGAAAVADADLQATREAVRPLVALTEEAKESEGGGRWLDDYAGELRKLHEAIVLCSEGGEEISSARLRLAHRAVLDYTATFEGRDLADALSELLLFPFREVERVARGELHSSVREAWQDVTDVWSSRLGGRYPFRSDATQAAAWRDVCDFFAAGGVLDKFREAMEGKAVQAGPALSATTQLVESVRRALAIEPDGVGSSFRLGAAPKLSDGTPLLRSDGSDRGRDVEGKIDKVLVRIGTQEFRYLVGSPKKSEALRWSTADEANTSCSLVLASAKMPPLTIEKSGSVWSWFRLIDEGTAKRVGQGRYVVTWSLREHGVEVSLELDMQDAEECPFLESSKFRRFAPPASPFETTR
jgi:type VI protein secretion system component VasK